MNLYTVSPGRPFLATLAEAILAGALPVAGGTPPDPIGLSRYTLLLPTRRATRALQEAFLAASGGRPLLLPKIKAIADGAEDLTLLAGSIGLGGLGASAIDIPPEIGELQRRLVLTQLVLQWSRALRTDTAGRPDFLAAPAAGAGTPAQAAAMAADLAALMDMVETEDVRLEGLDGLVPEEYAEHWNKTLDFLKIVVEMWPAYLAAAKVISPKDRRNRVLRAEAARLAAGLEQGPVIAAGITGSIPAAAEILRVVAGLPNGAIVLPGLDTQLDDDSFERVRASHPEHPQFGLARLLSTLGASRADVRELRPPDVDRAIGLRTRLIGESLRPAETTARWSALGRDVTPADAAAAFQGVHLLMAPTAQDEAEVVALILREALETPGRTAALVSPDRVLARRVGVRLAAWGIQVDDSAGRPFGKTVPGAFLDLVIEAATTDFAPAPLMALLKHPLCRLSLPARDIRRAARYLELGAFRAPYLGAGLDGVDAALEQAARDAVGDSDLGLRRPRAVRRLWEEDWTAARALVAALKEAFAPWQALTASAEPVALQSLAAAHVKIAETLARLPETALAADASSASTAAATAPRQPLYEGEAGTFAQEFFTELLDPELQAPALAPGEYPDFYRGLVSTENIRNRHALHPRLFIWGPFEARLQQPDVVVLGSLNDGVWPEAADPGPWLNRPMRATLGLPSPEEKIGHAAHDFTMLLGTARVYMTRAEKVGGVPTVPSRWLMRLGALLAGLGASDALATDTPWLAWARARDPESKPTPVAAPAPTPPVAMRPRTLAVTAIERWLANPYAIFAQHILSLDALPALGTAPDARIRGAIIHGALGRFATRHPDTLPDDIVSALLREADAVLESYAASPRVAAFWRPRLERFARWFAETEPGRRRGLERVVAERGGRHVLAAPFAPFTLTARADRIDIGPDGLTLIDYKTGAPPSAKAVASGRSPQLPLEALVARGNGFPEVPPRPVTRLVYIRATGGEPPGKEDVLDIADMTALVDAAERGLTTLVADYDQDTTPYSALRRASLRNAYRFDDFAHLARVDEWSGGEDAEE